MNKEIEALETGVGLKRIEDCVALAITGDDAQTWLNGQVTQNILRIDPKQAAYAFVLNVQGRILSDAWIFAH